MLVGIMATNGGPHSAEKQAVVTAGQIIQIGEDASGRAALEGRKLELKIIDILEDHHGRVQKTERGKIKELGSERLSHPLDPTAGVDAAVAAVIAAAKGSLYERHFANPDVQDYIRNVIGQHFATSMFIERDWHAKGHVIDAAGKASRNPKHDPSNPHVKAWAARYQGASA